MMHYVYGSAAQELSFSLQLHDNTNVTTDGGMTPEMKIYWDTELIDNAVPRLVHDQFAQKRPIPKNNGKTIEFRRVTPFPKALTPLTEGVTPTGRKMEFTAMTAEVKQYGDYVEISDVLDLTAVDPVLSVATVQLGDQAGATLDTVTREVLNAGTSVIYGPANKSARYLLTGGEAAADDNDYMNVRLVKQAARRLKVNLASKIDGYYVGIIHPDISFDLTDDPAWVDVKTYCDPDDMYEGEIGRLYGVRFVETTEAKIFHAEDLTAAARNLTVKAQVTSNTTVTVNEAISADEAAALAGRKVIIGDVLTEIASATAGSAGSASLTLKEAVSANASAVIYPGEAGADGRDVYSTIFLGANAYGVTEVDGGGLRHIVKPLGSGGTSDPLDQRSTAGWKGIKTAEILTDAFMVRVETASTYESGAN